MGTETTEDETKANDAEPKAKVAKGGKKGTTTTALSSPLLPKKKAPTKIEEEEQEEEEQEEQEEQGEEEEGQQRFEGVLSKWNVTRNYWFVSCPTLFGIYKCDVVIEPDQLPEGAEKGSSVSFIAM